MGLPCFRRVHSLRGWAFCLHYIRFCQLGIYIQTTMWVREIVTKCEAQISQVRWPAVRRGRAAWHVPGLRGTQDSPFFSLLLSHWCRTFPTSLPAFLQKYLLVIYLFITDLIVSDSKDKRAHKIRQDFPSFFLISSNVRQLKWLTCTLPEFSK